MDKIKKIILIISFLAIFILPRFSFAAIAATTNWEFNTNATANMLNGGGFNYLNAALPTDGAWTSANTTAPVLSSATYNFVAGDVGNWIYSSNTTNPGFYKITSVATNKATVNATIGQGVVLNTTFNRWGPSTIVGVDSSSSVSSKTFGVDYSQSNTAVINGVADFTSVGASTTMTSATAGFTPVMVGNIFHQTTTGTGAFGVVGWYEIATYVNATTVTLDRSENNGTASVNCTGYVGGALDLAGSLQTTFFSQINGGNFVFIKNGTYLVGAATTASGSGPTALANAYIIGYNAIRGDFTPSNYGSNRPIINSQTFAFSLASLPFTAMYYMNFTGTATTTVYSSGANSPIFHSKFTNTSSGANRIALTLSTSSLGLISDVEAVSQNGTAIVAQTGKLVGCYIHDSNIGATIGSAAGNITNTIFASNTTNALNPNSASSSGYFANNTFYGTEAKAGTGVTIISTQVSTLNFVNNIFYGFTTALTQTTNQDQSNLGQYNNFFNNTTDVTNYTKDSTDTAVNPNFVSVGQLTGTTATSSGAVLTDSGASFNGNVADGVDYLHVISGTGATVGIYLINSHTNTTLTVNNTIGTSSGGNLVYNVPNKHNYAVGTTVRATAFPGIFPGGLTTGFLDMGAVQRIEGFLGFFLQ